jgi:hypothetical protein
VHIQGRVYEADNVGEKRPIDWKQDCEFSESLDGNEEHGADDDIAEDLSNKVSFEQSVVGR